jgi:hypothetical protein
MKRFIHRENLKLLREQLARTTDELKCERIVRLIEDEELKDRDLASDHARGFCGSR